MTSIVLIAAAVAVVAGLALVLSLRIDRNARENVLPLLDVRQRAVRASLESDVRALARGPRSEFEGDSLARAARFVASRLQDSSIDDAGNVIAEVRGSAGGVVVIGAHYDTVPGSPGADDNASGVAALMELHGRFRRSAPSRTIRFIAFANEEPPFFQSPEMGSYIYATAAKKAGERIRAMVSLESIGYYSEQQDYPAGLGAIYPPRGNFLAFVSNLTSMGLMRRCARAFRASSSLPIESAALPELVTGVSWSDQWSFWRTGVPAIMVTDTAFFRNPHYHTGADTPETLDYDRLTLAVDGLEGVVRELSE